MERDVKHSKTKDTVPKSFLIARRRKAETRPSGPVPAEQAQKMGGTYLTPGQAVDSKPPAQINNDWNGPYLTNKTDTVASKATLIVNA